MTTIRSFPRPPRGGARETGMINVAAIRMQQFGVQFYQASLTAERHRQARPLRGAELRGRRAAAGPRRRRRAAVEGELGSARAPHRVEREGLPAPDHQAKDRRTRPVLRAVPAGARPAVDSRRRHHLVRREADVRAGRAAARRSGASRCPEREGILRAIDGQHRLLALHADIENIRRRALHGAGDHLRPPARRSRRADVRHDQREAHAAQRVAPRVSLSGRQLYRDDALAAAHDVVRALNDREDSPLHGEIKLLGVGRGRVAQAPLAQELKKLFAGDAFGGPQGGRRSAKSRRRFFVNYFKQISMVFGAAWNGRKYASSRRRRCALSSGSRRTSSSGSIRSTRIARDYPRHRPRHRAVGPPHRRSAVRDRRRMEAERHDGRVAGA